VQGVPLPLGMQQTLPVFVYPVMQVEGVQVPEGHEAVPYAIVQTVPHPPQLVTVVRAVSQPLATLLSQLPKPAEQVILQTDETQDAVPPAEEHLRPQPLQLFGSEAVWLSQPLVCKLLSQSKYPLAQVPWQVPEEHVAGAVR